MSVVPRTSSIAITTRPSSAAASYTATTLGWLSFRERTRPRRCAAIGADRIGHRDHLERDVTLEPRIARLVHHAHATRAQAREDLEPADPRRLGLHSDQPLAHAGAHGGGVEIVVSRPDPRESMFRDEVVLEAHGPIVPGRTIFGITLPRAPISRSCIPTVRSCVWPSRPRRPAARSPTTRPGHPLPRPRPAGRQPCRLETREHGEARGRSDGFRRLETIARVLRARDHPCEQAKRRSVVVRRGVLPGRRDRDLRTRLREIKELQEVAPHSTSP